MKPNLTYFNKRSLLDSDETSAELLSPKRMLDELYTIASIQGEIAAPGANVRNVLSSEVHTVAGVQRKRRNEVALAIDHQAFNVYDIRHSRLVASYPVSPQTRFSCSPRTLVRKDPGLSLKRFTYCAVSTPKPRILCFAESIRQGTGALPQTKTSKRDLKSGRAPIIHLDTYYYSPREEGNGSRYLLAVHEDGEITCYSEDLQEELWTSKAFADSRQVHLGALMNSRQATQALLKNREDALASVISTSQEEDNALLILLATRSAADDTVSDVRQSLHIFDLASLINGIKVQETTFTTSLREVTNISLSQTSISSNTSALFSLHTSSGTLYEYAEKSLRIYNLSGTTPKEICELSMNDTIESVLRISPRTIAINTLSSVYLIGLPYGVVQRKVDLQPSTSRRQKSDHSTPDNSSLRRKLLSFIAPSNDLVMLVDREIMIYPIRDAALVYSVSGKRKAETMLIDAIGKSSCARTDVRVKASAVPHKIRHLGTFSALGEDADWGKVKANLDSKLSEGDTESFATLVLGELQATTSGLPSVRDHKLVYLLGKIFQLHDEEDDSARNLALNSSLSIRLLPDSVFQYLLAKQVLIPEQIERCLGQTESLQAAKRLPPGSIVKALAAWDPTLECLRAFLASSTTINLEDLVYAIPRTVRRWSENETNDAPKLLTYQESDNEVARVEALSTEQVPQTASKPRSVLDLVISRFSRHPSNSVTRVLQHHLQTQDLICLIDILRVEIATAGWLSPYSVPATESAIPRTKQSLQPLLHLLNSTLDAVGNASFMLGANLPSITSDPEPTSGGMHPTDTANTIAYMRAEVAAALEGVEEAVYLSGLLDEFLLCARDQLDLQHTDTDPNPNTTSAPAAVGQIIPLTTSNENKGILSTALPLGLKPPQSESKIPLTKIGAGGELQKRSAREIGQMKSRRVGKYSFERIDI